MGVAPANLCVGDSTKYVDATTGGTWTSSSAANATVSATGWVKGIVPGFATISYSVGSCSVSQAVTVNTSPVLEASPVLTCKNVPTMLSVTGADHYSWSPATGLSCSTCSSTMATEPVTTVFTVTATNLAGCTTTVTVRDSIDLFVVKAIRSRDTLCAGSTDTFTASGTAVSYLWYPPVSLNCVTCNTVYAQPIADQD